MFLESPRFPDHISAGVTFGPEFLTVITATQGGHEQRNIVRSRALCVGECAHAVKLPAELADLLRFFRGVRGRAIPFRFKDWSDYRVTAADSALTLVAGTTDQYQINKIYEVATGYSELRPIVKPVANTVAVQDGGVNVPAAGAGGWSVDTTTGILTLTASQTRSISSHTVGAAHQVVLASALSPNVTVGQVVTLSGVTGAAAALLNGQHTVATVSSATLTLNTITTGLTATGGTLTLARQASTLAVSCEFDVPVRFDTDRMAHSVQAHNLYSWGHIPIVEVRL